MSDDLEHEVLRLLHRRYNDGKRYVKTWYIAEALDSKASTQRVGQIMADLSRDGYLEMWSNGCSSTCWRMTEQVGREVADA
ncbi:hypothetical protein Htur_5277 (plasmid) [Haloterrigena turkmenica DSM 5511]|uniref:DUF7123 domain-containing protein n=1 Tax=Haloterrigena turkmenica (strain ATCC 51198 / DSM 5511 / JCM 9101 / NCIMB 13204 / VKM B-1734 / 4k) TaxID=543526 RepID=D2S3Q8_HALTV|nr:hypothetical protein [Haloterrigena turkmenica]ADB64005.1 hypothetical protein Htur_5277 [Haloterrigena turkmenica DSM 5511]